MIARQLSVEEGRRKPHEHEKRNVVEKRTGTPTSARSDGDLKDGNVNDQGVLDYRSCHTF